MRKAVLLDRDGVINVEKNYVYKIEDFEFMEGVFELLSFIQAKGYLLFIVTNQSGIGRGYYSEKDFHILNDWMLDRLRENGIIVTKVYYCPYHPDYGIGKYKQESFFRKPNPGMIVQAAEEYSISLKKSVLIGDKLTDIEAGVKAGVGLNILLTKHSTSYPRDKLIYSYSLKDISQYIP